MRSAAVFGANNPLVLRCRFNLVLVLSLVLPAGCGRQWLAEAIVTVPHTSGPLDPAPGAAEQPPRGRKIDGSMRVTVGPPTASLSLRVVEPDTFPVPRGTILVLHGLWSRKQHMAGRGRWFADHGYRAVLVDLRGHGASSGRWGSFGVLESRDLVQVLDALEVDGIRVEPVGVFGPSWGGAAALQLAAIDPRVRAVVTVSTFTSMREIVPLYIDRYAPWLGLVISDAQLAAAIDQAGRLAGFDPDDADSLRAAAATDAQILFVHGADDANVPLDHGRALYRRAAGHSELLIIRDADHRSIMRGEKGQLVIERATAWFDRWLE